MQVSWSLTSESYNQQILVTIICKGGPGTITALGFDSKLSAGEWRTPLCVPDTRCSWVVRIPA